MYENYAQTKIDDLYTRMGNTILKELRQYDKLRKEEKRIAEKPLHARQKLREKKQYSMQRTSSIYQLRKALKKDFESTKNQAEHEKLEQAVERTGMDFDW